MDGQFWLPMLGRVSFISEGVQRTNLILFYTYDNLLRLIICPQEIHIYPIMKAINLDDVMDFYWNSWPYFYPNVSLASSILWYILQEEQHYLRSSMQTGYAIMLMLAAIRVLSIGRFSHITIITQHENPHLDEYLILVLWQTLFPACAYYFSSYIVESFTHKPVLQMPASTETCVCRCPFTLYGVAHLTCQRIFTDRWFILKSRAHGKRWPVYYSLRITVDPKCSQF